MKKVLMTLAVVGAAFALTAAVAYIPIQNLYQDGGTGTVTVAGISTNASSLQSATTNTFNLAVTSSQQANTNQFPSMAFGNAGGGLPFRNLSLGISFKGNDANATNDYVFRLAASVDGANWVSNWSSVSIKGLGTATVNTLTNIDTYGYPFVAMYTEEAKTVSGCTGITNLVVKAAGKANQ